MIGQEHIKGCVGLCTNSLISSPLLIGILKPCIVLPASDQYLTAEVFHYSVLHELIHYKRADLIYKWLIQFTLCLHWFNPFLYLVEREIRQLCELSCDEAVIKNLDSAERKAYGSSRFFRHL
ncbi:MAG: M56 family metallopeptidase [Eubacterium sp.]|nr:M56 family metallopeptidase [Eubacterium sp.]